MTKLSFRPSHPVWFAAVAAASVLSVTLVTSTTSETALRKSFSAAIEAEPSAPVERVAKAVPQAGSEDYWLNALRRDGNSPVTKTVAIGEKISMSLGGEQRTFEVASVAEFKPEITAVDTATAPTYFVLVTAKDVAKPASRPIRFVMEIEGTPAVIAGTQRDGRSL